MKISIFICILLAITTLHAAYYPELSLTVKPDTINKQIATYGKDIQKAINKYKISDIHGETTLARVKAKYNLTNLTQNISINWKGNVVTVKDSQTLNIHARHVNLTLDGQLDFKLGLTRRQKGPLKISISEFELIVDLKFVAPSCKDSNDNGLGFGIQIVDVRLDLSYLKIKIEGHAFDNLIIAQVQRLIIPRLPGIITKALFTQINPLLSNTLCNKIQQKLPVGSQNYILTVNTTQVPSFKNNNNYLQLLLDLTFQNLKTNDTNDELQKDYLPENPALANQNEISVALSSNFMNTVIWLVADSKLINVSVTNQMLGPDPPILLNTTNLSILMPKLKEKWPNKEVFLNVTAAGKYEHLLIRSGRLVTVINLSIKFIVNVTQIPNENPQQCLKSGGCVVACDLNMTLPLSASLMLKQRSAFGLIHSAQFYSIKTISSQIDINLDSLKLIINGIVNSALPALNSQLALGMQLPDQIAKILQKYNIGQINQQIFLDYIALGIKFDH